VPPPKYPTRAAQRGDAVVGADALEAGTTATTGLHAPDQFASSMPAMRALPWSLSVGSGSASPARSGLDADLLQRDGQQAGGDLFPGCHHRVVFARRAAGRSWHQATSWLVVPAMAETTTATSFPASTSRFTRVATLRCSQVGDGGAADFITMRDMIAGCQWAVAVMVTACGQQGQPCQARRFRPRRLHGSTHSRPLVGSDGPMRPLHR
jgi:hypothetical protein